MRLRVRRDVLTADTVQRGDLKLLTKTRSVRGLKNVQKRMLNPDKKVLDAVIRGLARNEKKFGEWYCPCRLRSGDKEKDRAIICPCIRHKDEIAQDGYCHCQLYDRKDVAEKMTGEKK